ncbi:MAG: DUF885 domain-containing protein [Myxococcales bacterium]|nr:DUF885 domain-containing protein [Myxococcales bacterium]
MFKPALAAIVLATLVPQGACGGARAPMAPTPEAASEASPLAAEASAGVSAPALRSLLERHWDQSMEAAPVWAGTLGDLRFADKIANGAEVATLARRSQLRTLLDEARAIDTADFDAKDRTTLALFMETLQRKTATEVCESFRWSVSARNNPVSSANGIADDHIISDLASARNLIKRYEQVAGSIDDSIANLRSGIVQGRVANAESIRRTVALVEGQLAQDFSQWNLLKPVKVIEGIEDAGAAALAARVRTIVETDIKAGFERYLAFLGSELVPKGRTGDGIGVHALPDGLACYEASIARHINLDKSAEEIHALGLTEIARINTEMAALGKSLFGKEDLPSTIAHLRTSKDLYFTSADEIVKKAETSLARAKAAIPEFFGILPNTDCVVTEIPAFEASFTTIAYYKQPFANGEKPGQYYINTYKPETRPRFEMEVLAYHESIPGHHLQIAISQERGDLPLFRRHGGSTAFVEGWALYTERLSDEMQLYSGDIDRMGMLSYDAWRASRLVVDTGIHAKGWTRKQAETFMREHTALTEGNIVNEVDRYVSWPGQAVAYKIGQLEILRLRSMAEEGLGDAFDIKGFHDAVLSQGAVTLPVLAAQVEAWVASVGQP